ncbi:hypothetical protein ACFS3C_01885 [Azotobacter vinelandii]
MRIIRMQAKASRTLHPLRAESPAASGAAQFDINSFGFAYEHP